MKTAYIKAVCSFKTLDRSFTKMKTCGICQTTVAKVLNMFEEQIGQPPILLSKVLLKCTRGTNRKYIRGGVCQTCSDDLCRYYEAMQIAKQVRNKILTVIESVADPELQSFKNEFNGTMQGESNGFGKIEMEIDDSNSHATSYFEVFEPTTNSLTEDRENEKIIDIKFQQIDPFNSDTEDEADETIPTCDECGATFEDHRSCLTHKRSAHRLKFICEQCGKILATRTSLLKHLQLHNPEKPLACNVCGKRYHFEVDLRNHMGWHTGEKPFECHVCGKRFVNFGSLSCHKIQHKAMPEGIECKICGKKFRKPSRLKNHMYTHDTLKPYKCTYCNYNTAHKKSLQFHLENNKNCSKFYKQDRLIEEQATAEIVS